MNQKSKTLITLIVATISAAGISVAQLTQPNSIIEKSDTLYLLGDYYNFKEKGADDSIDFKGGTVGYFHEFNNQNNLNVEFTYLNGSMNYSHTNVSTGNFVVIKYSDDIYRLKGMYGFDKKGIISCGLEYIYWQNDYSGTWNFTTTRFSNTYNANFVLADVRLMYPFELLSNADQQLKIIPCADVGFGAAFGSDDSKAAHKLEGKCALVYTLGRNSIILEGGYNLIGTQGDGNDYYKGIFVRAGYSCSW